MSTGCNIYFKVSVVNFSDSFYLFLLCFYALLTVVICDPVHDVEIKIHLR